eukprot:gnl/MRDRNA2_/MRDRNA2_74500_c0_seq2.p1 gnl/MRDRNA2_/MRDRNA2_74500_c0~~gnl/MRDRNA2_/MRDRNA2_74500_c0_seq2.p1  ORF type:complete len:207 (+),score=54.03 gnl/MRDRNA2_/MRDRNA2_74500_c0_seq2:72-623(+)
MPPPPKEEKEKASGGYNTCKEEPVAEASPAPEGDTAKADEDAIKAAKRAEIEAKVAALKAQKQKEEEQRLEFYGDHAGITCDGCGEGPLIGYRYRCKSCANHDVCESCYDLWAGGKGTVKNNLGKQAVSKNAADHNFELYKDKGFKSLAKGGEAKKVEKKQKPNEPCACGSGKKFKKCCGVCA